MVNAKTFLEKRYNDEMELEDAIHTAILTLKEGFEGQISENNIEIGIVNDQRKFRVNFQHTCCERLRDMTFVCSGFDPCRNLGLSW